MLGSLRIKTILFCLCVALTACNAAPPSPPAEAPKAEKAPEKAPEPEKAPPKAEIPVDVPKLEYIEMFTGGAKATDKLPMIIMVHGLGGHPKDMREIFSSFGHPARIILPQGPKPHAGASAGSTSRVRSRAMIRPWSKKWRARRPRWRCSSRSSRPASRRSVPRSSRASLRVAP